jgi:hypothetical protein
MMRPVANNPRIFPRYVVRETSPAELITFGAKAPEHHGSLWWYDS